MRRALGRAVAGAVAALAITLTMASIAPAQSITDNQRTLVVSLPGPFNGCGFLDAGATSTSNAIGDLVLPSAFTTNPNGNLVGAGGPIASAELVSLAPETIVYTIAPNQTWSNGRAFTGADLVAWWQRARVLPSVLSDGYRAIASLKLGAKGLSVTAVFSTPYANWNQLFRDVEAPSSPTGCGVANLVSRPRHGPYLVTSATRSRVVLVMNPHWSLDPGRYGRLVLLADAALPASRTTLFAGYSYAVTTATLQTLSGRPWMSSHLGNVSSIEEMTFAPQSALTRRILVREALSWLIPRQALINRLWGSVTFSPSVAASALYSQGQPNYPGGAGTGPSGQTTTTLATTTTVAGTPPTGVTDCASCVPTALADAGFTKVSGQWRSANGQPLRVNVVSGARALDRATANFVAATWRRPRASPRATVTSPSSLVLRQRHRPSPRDPSPVRPFPTATPVG